MLCKLFNTARSTYYYHTQPRSINAEQLELTAMIKKAFYLSKQSAGARTIASIFSTRQLAKRQLTWLRKIPVHITIPDAEQTPVNTIIRQLSKVISQ